MDIVALICSIISTGCAVFSAIFSIYTYQQQHRNDNKNEVTARLIPERLPLHDVNNREPTVTGVFLFVHSIAQER